MNQCLLTLIATPAIEESLVDWLLEHQEVTGFSSVPIDGHGSRPSDLTLAEQVRGRQRKVMFQVHTGAEQISALIASLKSDFKGAKLHYWVVPILEAGQIE